MLSPSANGGGCGERSIGERLTRHPQTTRTATAASTATTTTTSSTSVSATASSTSSGDEAGRQGGYGR